MPEANVNNNFFKGIYREVWRQLNPEGLTSAEVDFIVETARLDRNASCLDLMCGYGRHALELAGRGIQVTAVDNSIEYITELTEKVSRASLEVETHTGDVLAIDIHRRFDAVICMGNSFSFFNAQQAGELLDKIAGWLHPGGIFIFNSWMIAEIAIRHFREKESFDLGDYKYHLDYKFRFQPSRIESEHSILLNDQLVEVIPGVDYIFTLGELHQMVRQAGLRLIDFYSTPRKRKFSMGDTTIYIVVGKPS